MSSLNDHPIFDGWGKLCPYCVRYFVLFGVLNLNGDRSQKLSRAPRVMMTRDTLHLRSLYQHQTTTTRNTILSIFSHKSSIHHIVVGSNNSNNNKHKESLSTAPLNNTMKFIRVCVFVISLLSYVAAQAVTEADTATDGASAVDTTEIMADEEVAETSTVDQNEQETQQIQSEEDELPIQSGPFIDLLGPTLLSLEMTSETTATLNEHLTNDALQGKKVIGLYFSADWCGPCRQVSVTSSTT